MTKASGNGYDTEKLREIFRDILQSHETLASDQGAALVAHKNRIELALEDAKLHGIPKKELKALVKEARLEEKVRAIRESMEADQQAVFDKLKEDLGDYAETPLGQAALARHQPKQGSLDSLKT